MKNRYRIYVRGKYSGGKVWWIQDNQTNQRESLRTTDKTEAKHLLVPLNTAPQTRPATACRSAPFNSDTTTSPTPQPVTKPTAQTLKPQPQTTKERKTQMPRVAKTIPMTFAIPFRVEA
jgi:hypothetical protein